MFADSASSTTHFRHHSGFTGDRPFHAFPPDPLSICDDEPFVNLGFPPAPLSL